MDDAATVTAALAAAAADADAALADGASRALADYDRARSASPRWADPRSSLTAARHPANRARNRYTDVLPPDGTRVVLAPCPSGDPSRAHDYINASRLTSRAGESPHWDYVAAQGPLPGTVPDFWRMVAQARSVAVVSLTRAAEGGVAKCAPYYPDGEAGGTVVYGAYVVTAGPASPPVDGVVVRSLTVEVDTPASTPRPPPHTLVHIHVPDWPDHGVVQGTATLRTAAARLRAAVASAGGGPPVVHCSAGVGRTGTLMAVDICVRRLLAASSGGPGARDAAARGVALRRVVRRLRSGRPGMVQTPAQYVAALAAVRDEAAALAAAAAARAAGEEDPMLRGGGSAAGQSNGGV
jgi:protein tyrosine phosphatase